MDEDFPDNFLIEGLLFGETQQFHSAPLQLKADFQNDGDWFQISSTNNVFRPGNPDSRALLDWDVIVYLPEEGLAPIEGEYQWAVFDVEMNELHSGSESFRVPFSFRNTGNERYVRITANANQDVDPDTNETIDVPAYYRVGVGMGGDFAGDTIEEAAPYENNYQGVVSGGIRDIEDVDFHAVELEAGTEYQFTLYGRDFTAWELPDLENPTLELHDENGMLLDSSAFDAGGDIFLRARRLVYTPEQTGTYYLKVGSSREIGFAPFEEGTYIIRSPQFDDDQQAASKWTRTTLEPGDSFTNSVDFDGDVDWVRLSTVRYAQYNVQTDFNHVVLGGEDDFHEFPEGETDVTNRVVTDQGSATYAKFSPEAEVDFEFNIVDRHPDEDASLATRSTDVILGAIGTSDDVDLLKVGLVPFADYQFSVLESEEGAWTDSLIFEWLNPDASVARRFDITNEFNQFRIDADERYSEEFADADPATQVIRVRSRTGELTGYRVELTPLGEDTVTDVASEATDLEFVGSYAYVQGLLEGAQDFDAYRLQLEGGSWYQVSGFVSPSGSARLYRLVDGQYESVEQFAPDFNYWIEESGDYYLRVGESSRFRADGYAGYDLRVTADFLPRATTKPVFTDRDIPLKRFRGGRDLPTEVWSEVPLQLVDSNGNRSDLEANTLHDLSALEWNQLVMAPGKTGSKDIFYRNANDRRIPWETFEVVENRIPSEFQVWMQQNEFRILEYNFPDELPAYLADDARFNSSFEPVTDVQRNLTEFAINGWKDVRNQLFDGTSNPATAEIQIFQADLGPDVELLSFPPSLGEGIGSDLVLNSSSDLFALENSQETIFNLLRGIGTTFGLPDLDSVDRFHSVMGTAEVDPAMADVYPSWPMPLDTRLTFSENFNFSGTSVFNFVDEGDYVLTALGRPDNRIEVNAELLDRPVSISLEFGASSSAIGDEFHQVIHMGAYTDGYKGVGGDGNDGIKGSARNNILEGNGGNDVIDGGSGNDQLFGGTGDDYYIFKPASGLDQINEIDGGGTDVVRIEGMYDYDSIAEDFTFRRFGNDLLIRLELNGQTNNTGDQIRIRNMHEESSRVEALALLNTAGFVNRISLQSVWDQATEARQRFQIASGNDGFGTLVSPL